MDGRRRHDRPRRSRRAERCDGREQQRRRHRAPFHVNSVVVRVDGPRLDRRARKPRRRFDCRDRHQRQRRSGRRQHHRVRGSSPVPLDTVGRHQRSRIAWGNLRALRPTSTTPARWWAAPISSAGTRSTPSIRRRRTGIVDLPTLGGDETEPAAINESGQVVGYGTLPFPNSNDEHAFIWTLADGMLDLGVSDANDINNSGQIRGDQPPSRRPEAALRSCSPQAPNPTPTPTATSSMTFSRYPASRPRSPMQTCLPRTARSSTRTGTAITSPRPRRPMESASLSPALVRQSRRSSSAVSTLKLAPGSDVVVTCGSITVSVASGVAEVLLGDGTTSVTVPAGSTAKISDLGGGSYLVENVGESGDVSVVVHGNPSSVTPGQSTTVSTGDTTPPQVVCASAPTFTVGEPGAAVSASVSDGGSGTAATIVSAGANTSHVGTFTANVTGHDNAGNSTTVACTYFVKYLFQGFSSPIDNLPTINSAKSRTGGSDQVAGHQLSGRRGRRSGQLRQCHDRQWQLLAVGPVRCRRGVHGQLRSAVPRQRLVAVQLEDAKGIREPVQRNASEPGRRLHPRRRFQVQVVLEICGQVTESPRASGDSVTCPHSPLVSQRITLRVTCCTNGSLSSP